MAMKLLTNMEASGETWDYPEKSETNAHPKNASHVGELTLLTKDIFFRCSHDYIPFLRGTRNCNPYEINSHV